MGKKAKLGKFRKDKFYKLAKETGFRSRAAFKLIQLNRKFNFLQESQVCIDLCAAPGGWMQVAKQNMPVSSIVIGVDLYPIKPIGGCISLVADITTDKCKTLLKQELQSWKANVILHDGAPNVGKNWLFDAYQQICLTLNALKLATNFLSKGGWFVTKVFRSKDYNALLWVLKQLFRKVHATKPSASRKESAEIFVVCQGYLAPDKIDPKLLDVKYVFEELDLEKTVPKSLLHPDKHKRVKAEGYTEEDFKMRNELSVIEFMQSDDGLSALQNISAIIIDHDGVRNHPRTTGEILECCKDIKLLGRKDIKSVLNWWKHVRVDLFVKPEEKVEEVEVGVETKVLTQEEVENMEDEALKKEIAELKGEELRDLKRKRKKARRERVKLNDKLNLKMVIKGDEGPREEIDEIFELKDVETAKELDAIQDVSPEFVLDEKTNREKLPKYTKYSKDDSNYLDDDGLYENGNDSPDEADDSDGSDADLDKKDLGLSDDDIDDLRNSRKKKATEHPLIKSGDFRDKDSKRNQRAQLWFEKEKLQNIDDDEEDFDVDHLTAEYKDKGVQIMSEVNNAPQPEVPLGKKARRRARHENDKIDTDTSSEESSTEEESDNDGEGGDDKGEAPAKKIRLTEEELAIGAMMVKGRKTKRDLIDMAWNRYTFNDSNLPAWFVEDEEQHMRKQVPVPAEIAEEYENKVRELNVRPLKKVMEAKARKKRRAVKRLKKAQKQAEQILENSEASATEKARQLKKLYKKAAGEKKKDITYVVARKHLAGKRVRRPPGVKGRFKVVDPRMKKEKRAAKMQEKRKKGKKKGRN